MVEQWGELPSVDPLEALDSFFGCSLGSLLPKFRLAGVLRTTTGTSGPRCNNYLINGKFSPGKDSD